MTESSEQMVAKPPVVIGGRYSLCENRFYPCDWPSIFNTPEFFELHKNDASFYFQLCLGSPAQPVGVAHFTSVEPGCFRSPRRGTFGGFEFRERLRMEVVEGFVEEVEGVLKNHGAKTIEILEPPAILDPSHAAVLYNILRRRDYEVQAPELDYTLLVDGREFLERVEYNLQKRINKCVREGMLARRVEASRCGAVYDVIARNRAARGFPVSMSLEGILKMQEVFPDRIVYFGVFAGEALIASSICLRAARGLLYVFYWGDLPGNEKFSPVTLLAQAIYEYAQVEKLGFISLGTSTLQGVPNHGLVTFKREMGCLESLKLTFIKRFG